MRVRHVSTRAKEESSPSYGRVEAQFAPGRNRMLRGGSSPESP